MTKNPQKTRPAPADRTYLFLAFVAVAAVVSFYPLTRYYFLQDDFILLANAAFDPGSFTAAFGESTVLFRPLTKVLYFKIMYGIFGMNPLPYHMASLILHVLNVFLFFALLKKLNVSRMPALIITSVFALHVGFLDVIAWISCIQQLAGETFMLLGLILGIRAVETKRPIFVILTMLAYVLALLSAEQTYAVPLILFLYVYLHDEAKTTRARAARALRETAPYLAILVIYLLFMLLQKGIPREGFYEYHFGFNVVLNLLTYLVWVFDLSAVMPFVVDAASTGLTAVHILIVLLVVYNLARNRKRIVVFSTAYYFLTILPALFLEGHTYYLHNYIPSFGILLLAAPVVEDLYTLLLQWSPRIAPVTATVLICSLVVICFTKVRTNEKNYITDQYPLPKNFVLRRAIIAKNASEDIAKKANVGRRTENLFMVYKFASTWYERNVVAAFGRESALKLFYSDPNLNVFFHTQGDTLFEYDPAKNSEILFFDHMGHCFTPDEIDGDTDSVIQLLEPE